MQEISVQPPKAQLPEVKNVRKDEAAEAASQFEGVSIGEMMKIMMETVPQDERFGGGNAESIYKGMLSEQMGTAIVQKGGLGLAPHVLKEIIEMQGGK